MHSWQNNSVNFSFVQGGLIWWRRQPCVLFTVYKKVFMCFDLRQRHRWVLPWLFHSLSIYNNSWGYARPKLGAWKLHWWQKPKHSNQHLPPCFALMGRWFVCKGAEMGTRHYSVGCECPHWWLRCLYQMPLLKIVAESHSEAEANLEPVALVFRVWTTSNALASVFDNFISSGSHPSCKILGFW